MAELGIDQNLVQQALQNVKGAEEAVKNAPVAKQIKGMGIGGSGATELAVAQNLGTDNPLAALLGGFLQGKALNKADIKDAIDTAKATALNEKQRLDNIQKGLTNVKEDMQLRQAEIVQNVGTALSLANFGRLDEAASVLSDTISASTIAKTGVKTTITGFDPKSGKLTGFTQAVDEQGNIVGAKSDLRDDATLANSFSGVDISGAYPLAEQKRQERLAEVQADLAAAPTAGEAKVAELQSTLGRAPTDQERMASAGVLQRQLTSQDSSAFSERTQDKQVTEAVDRVRALDQIDQLIDRSSEIIRANPQAVTAGEGLKKLTRTVGTNLASIANVIPEDSAFGFIPTTINTVLSDGGENEKAFNTVLKERLENVDPKDEDAYRLAVIETSLGYQRSRALDPRVTDADLRANTIKLSLGDPLGIVAQLDEAKRLNQLGRNVERRFLERIAPEQARALFGAPAQQTTPPAQTTPSKKPMNIFQKALEESRQ